MYERHPDVSDEDLGIRAFHIKKAKAVERAIERLRQGMGPAWQNLNDSEIEELEWVFGELWSYTARVEWDDLRFGRLSMSDVVNILTLGSQLRRHARPGVEIMHEIDVIVKEKSGSEG
jgi:hypothetical protein